MTWTYSLFSMRITTMCCAGVELETAVSAGPRRLWVAGRNEAHAKSMRNEAMRIACAGRACIAVQASSTLAGGAEPPGSAGSPSSSAVDPVVAEAVPARLGEEGEAVGTAPDRDDVDQVSRPRVDDGDRASN